jgi:inositol hexakisphosphate/diphosphoinositol-pentakisphosphate kinase
MKSKKPMKKITLGICAMDKKAKSKPMREILSRLPADAFEIVMYGDDCILNTPVEEWPVVEVLITFYSTRFPTEKALEYIKLRNPFLLNDLEIDSVMKDRRKVYELLESQGIDVPHHVFLNREPGVEDTNQMEEHDEVSL